MDCNTCGAIREVGCNHAQNYFCDQYCILCGELVWDWVSHEYSTNCHANCLHCGKKTRVAPHYPSEIPCNNYCTACQTPLSNTANHTYDNDYDVDCNVCDSIREVDTPIVFGGTSASEDVDGLAFKFDVAVNGMEVTNGSEAVYDNALINGDYALIGMGAIISNLDTGAVYTHEDIGLRVIDVPAKYLFNLDQEAGIASYAVRVIDIPDGYKDAMISARPYFIYADQDGAQFTVYGDVYVSTYNDASNG